jgi:hypothetical protein
MTEREAALTRWAAAAVAIAPTVLLVSFLLHPQIGLGPPHEEAIATAVQAEPTRWGVAHIAVAIASGLMVLAFLALRRHLREAGEERSSILGVPFVVIGSTMFAVLPSMEMAPLAVVEAGGDAEAVQAELLAWFLPVLAVGAVTFAIGVGCFAKAINDSRVLSRRTTRVVVISLVVFAASRFVPLGAVQFYLQGIAAVLALWPMAYAMWTQTESRPAVGVGAEG